MTKTSVKDSLQSSFLCYGVHFWTLCIQAFFLLASVKKKARFIIFFASFIQKVFGQLHSKNSCQLHFFFFASFIQKFFCYLHNLFLLASAVAVSSLVLYKELAPLMPQGHADFKSQKLQTLKKRTPKLQTLKAPKCLC